MAYIQQGAGNMV